MADKPLTKKDLADVIQKVAVSNIATVKIENADDVSKPLIEETKKNDLKRLESEIEQRSVFQDIGEGLSAVSESISKGFSNLAKSFKTKGAGVLKFIGIALGAAVGLILAPVFAAGAFFSQLAVELKFLNALTNGRLGKIFAPVTNFFTRIGDFFKVGFDKVLKVFDNVKKILSGVTSSGGKLGKFFGFLKKVASVVKKVFDPLTKGFKKGFGIVTKFAKVAGRVLGKLFLPITILMSVFDFVKGFMKGFKEDGIIGGLKEGIISVVDGLFGGILRLLIMIPAKIASLLGFEELSKSLKEGMDTMLESIYGVFGGLVDLVVGVFTLDTEKITTTLKDIWQNIQDAIMAPLNSLKAVGKDIKGFFGFGKEKEEEKRLPTVNEIMKSSGATQLDNLESTAAPIIITTGPVGMGLAPNPGNQVFAPTTNLMNDHDRSTKALRKALRSN